MELTFAQVGDILDELADAFPQVLFQGLNGGVNLLEKALADPEFPQDSVYILGEYCNDLLGKYINLYYGSFTALARKENWTMAIWRQELWDTLSHELTHHIEGLGGLHGLDDKDAAEMAVFRRAYRKQPPGQPDGTP